MSRHPAPRRPRVYRPAPDMLEGRRLLDAAPGPRPADPTITYSFMPDGTSLGGVPSDLGSALAAQGYAPAEWQDALREAAQVWGEVLGVHLVEVPDDGEPLGVPVVEGGDGRFGEIRVGGMPLPDNHLGMAFIPTSGEASTLAGTVLFNTAQPWADQGGAAAPDGREPGAGGHAFDFYTVAMHEIGHALGFPDLDADPEHDSVLADIYTGPKSGLSEDDLAWIQTILGGQGAGSDSESEPAEGGVTQVTLDLALAPGGQAVVGVRIDAAGFYTFRLDAGAATAARLTIGGTGERGPIALDAAGVVPTYLVPGKYLIRVGSAAAAPLAARLTVSDVPFDAESILANGVGQGPALAVSLVGLAAPSPGPAPSPTASGAAAVGGGLFGVPAAGPSATTPSASAAATPALGLVLVPGGVPVGQAAPGADHVGVVGPAVTPDAIALADLGETLPPGIDYGTALPADSRAPRPGQTTDGAMAQGPGDGGGVRDEAALADVRRLDWLLAMLGERTAPDMAAGSGPDPDGQDDPVEVERADLVASPSLGGLLLACVVIRRVTRTARCRPGVGAARSRRGSPADPDRPT
jgi:hypothetical protein